MIRLQDKANEAMTWEEIKDILLELDSFFYFSSHEGFVYKQKLKANGFKHELLPMIEELK